MQLLGIRDCPFLEMTGGEIRIGSALFSVRVRVISRIPLRLCHFRLDDTKRRIIG